jgi:alkylation response protein AidB-like acyl-CoA dehydrogenase
VTSLSSTQATRKPQSFSLDWRSSLASIASQIAEEGRRCDRTGEFVAGNFAALRERGFLELGVPVELGGGGLSITELGDLLRELAHHCPSTALALAMHTHGVAVAAWRWRHQKAPVDGLLKRIASERVQLLSSGGSDWLPGSGHATKVEGGYRVLARKIFASGAPSAQLFMTGAIEQGAPGGPTVLHFGVPMNAAGVSIVDTWDTLGMRGTASNDVTLEGVFVPDAAIAARRKPGVWHPSIETVAMIAIPLVYAVYVGVAEAARDIAVAAVKKRRASANVEAIGALDTELEAARIAYRSMMAFAETAQPGPQTTNTTFMHRALVSRSVLRTVELALEAVGGFSFYRSLGLERLFRDVQGARFHPLQDAPQRRLAGRLALELPIDD